MCQPRREAVDIERMVDSRSDRDVFVLRKHDCTSLSNMQVQNLLIDCMPMLVPHLWQPNDHKQEYKQISFSTSSQDWPAPLSVSGEDLDMPCEH